MGLSDTTKEKIAIEKDKIEKSMKRLKVLSSRKAVEKFGKEGVQKLIKKEKDNIERSKKVLESFSSNKAKEGLKKENLEETFNKAKEALKKENLEETFNKAKEGLKKENLEETFNKAKEGLKKENLEETFNKAKEGLNRININEDYKKLSKKKIDEFYPIVQNVFRYVYNLYITHPKLVIVICIIFFTIVVFQSRTVNLYYLFLSQII
jgi:hypothetical protein